MTDDFTLHFWGVRGSHPSPGPQFIQTGGNTSCVEVRVAGQRLICDAGTGLVALGEQIIASGSHRPILILLSHYHHDHLQGLPHFQPLYHEHQLVFLVAPWNAYQDRIWELLIHASARSALVERPGLRARRRTLAIEGGERLWWNADDPNPLQLAPNADAPTPTGFVEIKTYRSLAHPRGGSMCYRIEHNDHSIVFATDTESYIGSDQGLARFAKQTNLIIHDAHFTPDEYSDVRHCKQGWGHSTWEMAVDLAKLADISRVALFHHDPAHDDTQMQAIETAAQAVFPQAFVAREGADVTVREAVVAPSTGTKKNG